jgi:limonene-1,2-epoxide hydrolase
VAIDPEPVVRALCAAIEQRCVEAVAPLLEQGVVYHNVPLSPVIGRAAVLADLARQFAAYDSLVFRIEHLAAVGPVVLTERVDLLGRDGVVIEMPVMGVFEIATGQIAAWRDYFDLGQFQRLREQARADQSSP